MIPVAEMTFGQFAAKMQQRAGDVEGAMRRATQKATDILHAESKSIMNTGIYSKPEDVSSTGKKRWRRTGNLRNSERSQVLSAYEGAVDNSAAYALPRHNLGYGPSSPEAIDPKPTKAKNTTRHAPFRTRAISNTAKVRFDTYLTGLRNALYR